MKTLQTRKEGVLAEGEYTLSKCQVDSRGASRAMAEIEEIVAWGRDIVAKASHDPILKMKNMQIVWSEYRRAIQDFHRLYLTHQLVLHNKVVDRGTEMLARIISGDVTYTGIINYCALGTGTAAGAAGDTQLGTEVFRKLKSSGTYSSNQAFVSTFFTATETTGTYGEVGHFVDGTGTANSGRLFSRIGDPDTTELSVTKSSLETLTIDYKATFTAA